MPRSARSAVADARGVTLVEIVVALAILSAGVMALVGSSAMASRMIGRGRGTTVLAHVAGSRAELLRRVAAGTTPRCSSLVDGTAGSPGSVVERWTVLGTAGDPARDVRLTLDYRVPGGNRTDTVMLSLDCR